MRFDSPSWRATCCVDGRDLGGSVWQRTHEPFVKAYICSESDKDKLLIGKLTFGPVVSTMCADEAKQPGYHPGARSGDPWAYSSANAWVNHYPSAAWRMDFCRKFQDERSVSYRWYA